MADMNDSGRSAFEMWARQEPAPNGKIFYNRWLGEFDPHMTGETANRLLDHVDKITTHGQQAFIRGWESARADFLKSA